MDINKCGKKKIKKPSPETYQNLSVNDMKLQLKGFIKNIHKLNRQELCNELYKLLSQKTLPKEKKIIIKKQNEALKENPSKIIKKVVLKEPSASNVQQLGFIKYDGSNSCYIDSTIFSLFHTPNKYIKNILIKNNIKVDDKLYKIKKNIREEILTLYNDLHKNYNKDSKCSHLRSLFSSFDKQYKQIHNIKSQSIEWTHSQQEPRDVINMILKIFDTPQTIKVKVITKSDKRIEKRWFNDPIIDIDVLMSHRKIYLKDYFPKNTEIYTLENDIKFKKISEIIDSNFLIINITRNFLNEEKIITPVIPEEHITLTNKKQLNCASILIHLGNGTSGGHYTCVFKYFKDDKWYHYDDMNNEYKLIGSFTDMLKWNHGFVKKNMVMCNYLRL